MGWRGRGPLLRELHCLGPLSLVGESRVGDINVSEGTWSMNWALGESREDDCETMGRMGGRCWNFLCILGIP